MLDLLMQRMGVFSTCKCNEPAISSLLVNCVIQVKSSEYAVLDGLLLTR